MSLKDWALDNTGLLSDCMDIFDKSINLENILTDDNSNLVTNLFKEHCDELIEHCKDYGTLDYFNPEMMRHDFFELKKFILEDYIANVLFREQE